MEIRVTARGNEMIDVRDIGEPLQPASGQAGRLLTVSMLGKRVSNQNSINAPIVTNQSVLLRNSDNVKMLRMARAVLIPSDFLGW
jgi:hypothetical protein